MKTAKEYADQFNEIIDPFSDRDKMNEMVTTLSFSQILAIPKAAVNDVLNEMYDEFLDLANTKGKESENALYACWVETNTKWIDFINLVHNKNFPFSKDNLRKGLRAVMPELEETITLFELNRTLLKKKHKKEALDEKNAKL